MREEGWYQLTALVQVVPWALRVIGLLFLMCALLLTLSGCGTTRLGQDVPTTVLDELMLEAGEPVALAGEPTIEEALQNLWVNGTVWKETRDRLGAFQRWACERGFAGDAHCRRFHGR